MTTFATARLYVDWHILGGSPPIFGEGSTEVLLVRKIRLFCNRLYLEGANQTDLLTIYVNYSTSAASLVLNIVFHEF